MRDNPYFVTSFLLGEVHDDDEEDVLAVLYERAAHVVNPDAYANDLEIFYDCTISFEFVHERLRDVVKTLCENLRTVNAQIENSYQDHQTGETRRQILRTMPLLNLQDDDQIFFLEQMQFFLEAALKKTEEEIWGPWEPTWKFSSEQNFLLTCYTSFCTNQTERSRKFVVKFYNEAQDKDRMYARAELNFKPTLSLVETNVTVVVSVSKEFVDVYTTTLLFWEQLEKEDRTETLEHHLRWIVNRTLKPYLKDFWSKLHYSYVTPTKQLRAEMRDCLKTIDIVQEKNTYNLCIKVYNDEEFDADFYIENAFDETQMKTLEMSDQMPDNTQPEELEALELPSLKNSKLDIRGKLQICDVHPRVYNNLEKATRNWKKRSNEEKQTVIKYLKTLLQSCLPFLSKHNNFEIMQASPAINLSGGMTAAGFHICMHDIVTVQVLFNVAYIVEVVYYAQIEPCLPDNYEDLQKKLVSDQQKIVTAVSAPNLHE